MYGGPAKFDPPIKSGGFNMITLVNVTEQNWLDVISLRVHEKQKRLIGRSGNRGSIMDKS